MLAHRLSVFVFFFFFRGINTVFHLFYNPVDRVDYQALKPSILFQSGHCVILLNLYSGSTCQSCHMILYCQGPVCGLRLQGLLNISIDPFIWCGFVLIQVSDQLLPVWSGVQGGQVLTFQARDLLLEGGPEGPQGSSWGSVCFEEVSHFICYNLHHWGR